ncbi:hypothetical protein AB0M34_25520 [Nocardia sp. NPDC050193]
MKLRPGLKLNSVVSTAQIIVVRAPADDVDLRCGGAPMTADGAPAATDGGDGAELLMGKRYGDEAGELEVLCTKPGRGPLSVGDRTIPQKAAKPLPASD